jgi:RNA polymerase sigma factor (TIGR02999 family)
MLALTPKKRQRNVAPSHSTTLVGPGAPEPPASAATGEVTRLLVAARQGDHGALGRLMPFVYDELRIVARQQLRRRPRHTLDTTGLVHETYLRLVDQSQAIWKDRAHFLASAAVAMRHILVDQARRRTARKRGGEEIRVTLDEAELGIDERAVEILALDEALTTLADLSERLARLVELRFFGGLTEEETAEALGTSERTVRRDWQKARAYLYLALSRRAAG